MSNITVRIPTPLRPFVEDASVLDAHAETVGAALAQVWGMAPGEVAAATTATAAPSPAASSSPRTTSITRAASSWVS